MIPGRTALILGASALAAVLGFAPPAPAAALGVPDPECEKHWREGRLPPPPLAQRCADEFRRLALTYRQELEALAFRFPGDMVWLPGEERIARITPAELFSMRARGDALERILPERERLEAEILGQSAGGAEALARYRQVLRAELALDLATAERSTDAIEAFRARHAARHPERSALADVADAVAREARERLAAAERFKFDPTLRGFVWLARMPDGAIRAPSPEEPPDDAVLGDVIVFGDPPPIDFPVPGDGGVCPGEPRQDGFAYGPQDDGTKEDGPPLGDGFTLGEPDDIVFPVPGEGGVCPSEPRQDGFAYGPQDDGAKEEGPPLGDGFTLGEPDDIVFPVPGEGGVCPVEPSDDAIPPPIDLVTNGYRLNDARIAGASRDPRIQVVIVTFPSLQVGGTAGATGMGGPPDRQVPGGGISDAEWDPELRIYVTSLGHLGPGGVEVNVVGSDPATISGETLVLEPVTLTRDATERLLAERQEAAREGSQETTTADVYCVELHRVPPPEGTYFRVGHPEIQLEHEPERRVVAAAGRVRDAGGLVPDSDLESYFQSILQWSIWSVAESFDASRFEDALVEHTKKNVQAADQRWTEEIERAVRGLAPQRWRDIQKVLEETRAGEQQPQGGTS